MHSCNFSRLDLASIFLKCWDLKNLRNFKVNMKPSKSTVLSQTFLLAILEKWPTIWFLLLLFAWWSSSKKVAIHFNFLVLPSKQYIGFISVTAVFRTTKIMKAFLLWKLFWTLAKSFSSWVLYHINCDKKLKEIHQCFFNSLRFVVKTTVT